MSSSEPTGDLGQFPQTPRPPRATYRLQLRDGVTLRTAHSLVPYLRDLGAADLYLSPIFAARSGSAHGYDIVDPTRIDPTVGTHDDLGELASTLRSAGMGLIIDIVPNHLSTSTENRWWRDVLQRGRDSEHAAVFDIEWSPPHHPDLEGKVLLPVLGDSLDAIIGRGELRIGDAATPAVTAAAPAASTRSAEPVLHYGDLELPLSAGTDPDMPVGEVLAGQHYVLEHWRTGAQRVNWRRFFGLSELVGVRVEDPAVFELTHSLVGRLVREDIVTGLRVDHIDGLRDPLGYLERLQALCGAEPGGQRFPVVVEKILHHDEDLPEEWPVLGTTGYEFLGAANAVFVDPIGFSELESFYRAFTGERRTYREIVDDCKRDVLDGLLSGDLDRVAAHRGDEVEAREAVVSETVSLGVYRTYERGADVPRWVLDWQQLTGGVTAKAVEDTAFYVYVPLASVNEVGGGPDAIGDDPVQHFHRVARRQLRHHPHGLNTTATHDTKRGEDTRVRIDVLSEIPREWSQAVHRWRRSAERHMREVGGRHAPDAADEILLYQTLLGAWPVEETASRDFAGRVTAYMIKAARESARNTSWHDVDAAYEEALTGLAEALLDDQEFLDDFLPFAEEIAWHGMLNGLSQVVLRIASPGVPDTYQGAELWDLSLVDPDNRRPVDFEHCRGLLRDLDEREPDWSELLRQWRDGRVKLAVTSRALRARRTHRELFDGGDYLPAEVSEDRIGNVVSFVRRGGDRCALTIASRLTTRLGTIGEPPVGAAAWHDSMLIPPQPSPSTWVDALTGRTVEMDDVSLPLADVLRDLPVAMLISQ